MVVIISIILSLLLHLFVGWELTIIAGVVAGYFGTKLGPIQGMLSVGIAWTILLFWNFVVDASASSKLVDFLSGMLGDIGSPALMLIIIGLGLLMGLLGGMIGQQFRMLFSVKTKSSTATSKI